MLLPEDLNKSDVIKPHPSAISGLGRFLQEASSQFLGTSARKQGETSTYGDQEVGVTAPRLCQIVFYTKHFCPSIDAPRDRGVKRFDAIKIDIRFTAAHDFF